MTNDIKQMSNLALYGGRWSVAASARDHMLELQDYLESLGIPFVLTFHPRPGW